MNPDLPTPRPVPDIPDHAPVRCIGAGAYGEVWLARSALGTWRAVKVVRRDAFDDDRPYEREFAGLQQFEPLSRTHEGLVDLLQVGRNDAEGWFYCVMELADPAGTGSFQGSVSRVQPECGAAPAASPLQTGNWKPETYVPLTLASLVKRHGPLPLDDCLPIARTLTGALAELHRHGLVHRDVKPSNIVFVGGVPKLADVGLVAAAKGVGQDRSFVGTEGFFPPEGPGTPQADLYSLGIVLYVLATGQGHRDFPEPPADLARRPDRARYLEFSAIIHRACQADPRDRYPSAGAMLADLRLLDAGKSVQRRHSLQRAWQWTWKAAALGALLALAFVLLRNERDRRAALVRLEATPFEKSGTTNLAAWRAVVRGRTMGGTFAASGFSHAIPEYERAVALDPNYVAAWNVLAESLFLSVDKGLIPGGQALARARFCAGQAVKLDPANGRALHWLGQCDLALDYDFTRAEPRLRRAVQLAPGDWALRHNLAYVLWFYGRFDEAEAILNQVIREQPSPRYSHVQLGMVHASCGRLTDALAALDESLLLDPNWPSARLERAEILWALDRRPEAARDWQRFVDLEGFSSLTHEDAARLNVTLDEAGPDRFVQALIALLEARRAAGRFVSAYDLVLLQAKTGNKARALDYLEQAVDEHRLAVLGAKVHIAFRDFQDEPRYHAVLRRLKLEP